MGASCSRREQDVCALRTFHVSGAKPQALRTTYPSKLSGQSTSAKQHYVMQQPEIHNLDGQETFAKLHCCVISAAVHQVKG